MKLNSIQQAILITIKYFDIFDYPPTCKQIHKYLYQEKSAIKDVAQALTKLEKNGLVGKKNNYWFLKGRKELTQKRIAKEKHSKKLKSRLFYLGWLLKLVPFIRSVVITNNLAFNNAGQSSDIDLLILTKKDRLWTTRFFTTLIINLTGLRVMNKKADPGQICLNFFLDEGNLSLLPIDRDYQIFRSYWIALSKPLYDHGLFGSFLENNSWALANFPNLNKSWLKGPKKALSIFSFLFEKILSIFKKSEDSFYNFQKRRIDQPHPKSKLSDEVIVSSSVFKSHFNNHRQQTTKILERYQLKLKN